MADYDIISNISSEIIMRLKRGMPQVNSIGLVNNISNAHYLLNLFMYDIEELDRTLYNADSFTTVLRLKYIIFVESKGEEYQKPYDDQKFLGKAIQILNDNKAISHDDKTDCEPYALIELDNIGFDEKVRLKADMKNQRPVLFYKVQPVFIDSENTIEPAERVTKARFDLRGVE